MPHALQTLAIQFKNEQKNWNRDGNMIEMWAWLLIIIIIISDIWKIKVNY